jgi:hypothetical protein
MPQNDDAPVSTVPPAPEPKKAVVVDDPAPPAFGPGSRINWDNPKNAPNQRKSIRHDPKGLKNRELL